LRRRLRPVAAGLLVACLSSPVLGQEPTPLAWPAAHRHQADVASTALVIGQITADTIVNLRAADRRRALGCEALRLGLAAGAAELTKLIVHRTRPDGSDQRSFYSGHTTLAAAASGWNVTVGLSLTFGTGYLRLAANKHYASDVAVGFGAGLLARRVCSAAR
jgi:membrane-associated phospholipid phosphatase